jgi:uncharacterized membrane protein YeaQ/YmgE (transglycosylase-associated protein family)
VTNLLQPSRRALTSAEAEHLRDRIRLSGGRRFTNLVIAGGLFVGLWLLTPWGTDKQFWVATLTWLVIGAVLVGWAYWDLHRQSKAARQQFESALRRNAADVFAIKATRFVEFDEVEDEGAAYAFELQDGRIVLITGQDFYAHDTFPCLDFSITHLLDENDEVIDLLVESHAEKAAPARVVPATAKLGLNLPAHLTLMEAPFETIEDKLRAAAQP